MEDYRICFNSAPHSGEWWEVMKKRRGLFGREVWKKTTRTVWAGGYPLVLSTFSSEAGAKAWVAEDKKPRVHTCKPA